MEPSPGSPMTQESNPGGPIRPCALKIWRAFWGESLGFPGVPRSSLGVTGGPRGSQAWSQGDVEIFGTLQAKRNLESPWVPLAPPGGEP